MNASAYSPPRTTPLSGQRVASTDQVECVLYDLDADRSESAPQLFLAHATGFHGRVYGPLAQRLPDYHCYTADLRGHGAASSPLDHHYEWQGFTEDLARVFAALPGEGPRFGFGHSMGAALLLRLEQRNPGTFSALYCFEPIVPTPELQKTAPRESPLVAITRKRRNTFSDRAAAYANFASKAPLDLLDPECLSAYVEWGFRDLPDGSVELELPGREEAEVYSMSTRHDTFAELAGVRCPVAVAHGALESMTASAWASAIAAALPAGELLPFPELGHFGPLQDLDRIAESISSFFASST